MKAGLLSLLSGGGFFAVALAMNFLSPGLRIAAVFALILTAAAPSSQAQAARPPVKGQRVFTCGHSFHVWVHRMLAEMAKSAGIEGHESVGLSSIGGSRVIQHWDVPDEKNAAKTALAAGKVDVLTLSPIWLPDEGIEKFAKLANEHNPKIYITVQQFWLPNDTYEPKYPLDTRKKVDHDATDLDALQKAQDQYDKDIHDAARKVNEQLGRQAIVTVPVGQAAVALRRKIVAGEAPGLVKQWDLFRDTWGHPQAALRALSAYCHFALIYGSPVGLPVPADLAKAVQPAFAEKLNRLLQELAWEAVKHHPIRG